MSEQVALLDRADPRPAPWVFDVLLGIGVTLIVSFVITADVEGSGPDGWAYLWAVGLGGLMLVRRRYPVIVVVLSAGAVISYHAAGFPAIGVAVPLAAAVFSAAECGRVAAAIIASASVLLISVSYRLAVGHDLGLVVGYELPGHALLLAAAIAFGDSLRSRRELRRRSAEIAELVAERYARESEQRAMAERLAIARELHDSVGQALTVVTLHTQIAEEALDADGPNDSESAVRDSLKIVATTTSSTLEDVRRTVASLRKEEGMLRPPLRINDLESAILPAKQAGLQVRTRVLVRSPLSATIEAAIFRIVQESITNVVRHSDASRVEIDIEQTEDTVTISVVNDSRSGPEESRDVPVVTGSGLAGMRERTTLLGGTFSAGRQAAGFVVRAQIPLEVTG